MRGGITGHRDLKEIGLVKWLETCLRKIIEDNNIDFGYTCLAQGADELFTAVLRTKDVDYTAIIPCENYEVTFDHESLATYNYSLQLAKSVVKLDYTKPSEEAFDVAGKLVVLKSDVLIAIWDGKEAKGLGGTGDIVEFAQRERKKIIHLNTLNKSITEIR